MGDIADMILDGTLDCETGEYIGEQNMAKYGVISPGFPVSYDYSGYYAEQEVSIKKKFKCEECGRRFKTDCALKQHKRDSHKFEDKDYRDLNDRVKRLLRSKFNKKHDLIYEWIKSGKITKRDYFDFISYEVGKEL